jgi:hypothetical protein
MNIGLIHENKEEYTDAYKSYSAALNCNQTNIKAENAKLRVKKIMDEKQLKYFD